MIHEGAKHRRLIYIDPITGQEINTKITVSHTPTGPIFMKVMNDAKKWEEQNVSPELHKVQRAIQKAVGRPKKISPPGPRQEVAPAAAPNLMQGIGLPTDMEKRQKMLEDQQMKDVLRQMYPEGTQKPKQEEKKLAGYDYSMNEQKQFINENGVARNLDKLDLSGTHYPEELESQDDDYFLWG